MEVNLKFLVARTDPAVLFGPAVAFVERHVVMVPYVSLPTCRYNGLNHRVRKILWHDAAPQAAATTIDYYYNAGWQVVEERVAVGAGSAQVHTQYLWCPSYIDTPVLRWRDTSEVPNQTLNETLYYTVDANKNVTALITPNGQVVERYLYDPYGRVTFLKPDWSLQEVTGHADGTASAFGNEILFTGYRYNPETGYYQVRHREFNPLMGRWMQRDPLGYVDGGNLYAGYFVMWGGVDPMGLRFMCPNHGADTLCGHADRAREISTGAGSERLLSVAELRELRTRFGNPEITRSQENALRLAERGARDARARADMGLLAVANEVDPYRREVVTEHDYASLRLELAERQMLFDAIARLEAGFRTQWEGEIRDLVDGIFPPESPTSCQDAFRRCSGDARATASRVERFWRNRTNEGRAVAIASATYTAALTGQPLIIAGGAGGTFLGTSLYSDALVNSAKAHAYNYAIIRCFLIFRQCYDPECAENDEILVTLRPKDLGSRIMNR